MARPCTRRSPHRNPLPGGEDELAAGLPGAPTKGSNIPTHSPAVFRAPTPAPPSTNTLFKQFMKVYLKSTKDLASFQKSANDPLKLRCRMYIWVNYTWTATTSVSSVKIILRSLGPPGPTEPPLQLPFFVRISAYNRRSSNVVEVKK